MFSEDVRVLMTVRNFST